MGLNEKKNWFFELVVAKMFLPIDRGFDRKFSFYFRNKVTGRLVVPKIGRSHSSFMLYSSFTWAFLSLADSVTKIPCPPSWSHSKTSWDKHITWAQKIEFLTWRTRKNLSFSVSVLLRLLKCNLGRKIKYKTSITDPFGWCLKTPFALWPNDARWRF